MLLRLFYAVSILSFNIFWNSFSKSYSFAETEITEEGSQLYENIVQLKMLANDGKIAKNTRDNLEKELGKSVISKENALNYKYINDKKLIEDKKSKKKK